MSKETVSRTTELIANFTSEIRKKITSIFSRFSSRKIKVETEVKGTEKIEEVKHKVESLPKTKTVEVKVEKRDHSGLTEANEKLRQKGDEYLKQLEQLASQENLSNANKAQAAKALGKLTKAYGDPGIKPDETTGKLTGVDSVLIRKAEKDNSRKIKELEAELRELENSNHQQAEIRDKAGLPVWFGGNIRPGGREASEQRAIRDAEKTKGAKLTDSEIEATRKLHELSWNMQNMRDQQFGDLSTKINFLTARAGFQSAAAVPDSDKYNREILMTNKTMLNVLQSIETRCSQLNKF